MAQSIVQPITSLSGRGLPLPGDDIDTDRIIPARFMRCVTFEGLGEHAFHDERFESDGTQKQHPLNEPKFKGNDILLVGGNFGCGSSREHAPQALRRFGIRALIGISFADIFAGNCVAMGIPAVSADSSELASLMAMVEQDPSMEITIDLEEQKATVGEKSIPISLPEPYRIAFTQGLWDTTSVLLQNKEQIEKTAATLPYTSGFAHT